MKKIVPILFIIFNRPEIARQSFEHIKAVKPKRLYIASDGPRNNKKDEDVIVKRTRDIILSSIDWDCEVKSLFQESNLGCGPGVYTAINWLFTNEEYGIILEDDCVINETCYRYMSELLEKYKDDQRVGMIAGTNPFADIVDNSYSYYFSRFKSCWGWATWKRAWINMDMDMKWRIDFCDSVIYNSGYAYRDKQYWKWEMDFIDKGYVSAWDWQWYFTLAAQNQLCIYPKVNLVTNIGNVAEATHKPAYNISYKSFDMEFPLNHPTYMVPIPKFEKAFYKRNNSFKKVLGRMIPYALKQYIKSKFY